MRRILSKSLSTRTTNKMSNSLPISQLPLPSAKDLLIHNLTPDVRTPSVSHFRSGVLGQTPSYQRRARLLSPESHFSFVAPLPLQFPYEIEPPEPPAVIDDKDSYIENWLAKREATIERATSERIHDNGLRIHDSDMRQQPRRLIGLAGSGLRDCLPHLDVGNSFEVIGEPNLLAADSPAPPEIPLSSSAQELLDVLGAHSVLMSSPDAEVAFAPWSLRYSGHQFGVWAGQLGDGRANSVREHRFPTKSILVVWKMPYI
jgi:serine/tyrosine/threonine adenylyltransferase